MNVKDILIGFVGGAVVGGVVMRIVDTKTDKKKKDDNRDGEFVTISAEELEEYRAQLRDAEEDAEYWHNRVRQITAAKEMESYTGHSEEPIHPEEFEEDLEPVEAPEENPGEEMDIYAITVGDFMQDAKYEKKYLSYYRVNGVLSDAGTDEVIDAPRMAVGDMMDIVENYTGNVMYIRNTHTSVDYQIDFEDAAYDGGGDA